MTIEQEVQQIESREQFIAFVERLAKESESQSVSWENATLPAFLSAMAVWTADMDGYFRNSGQPVPDVPTWRLFAQILAAARVYE